MRECDTSAAAITRMVIATLAFMLLSYPAAAQSETMLYLVEFEAEAGAPTSRDQVIGLLSTQVIPSLESLSKDARIRAGGALVGARAGVFIVAAKSHDEVTEMVEALPFWGFLRWKVTPLESFGHRVALERKVVERLRAAP